MFFVEVDSYKKCDAYFELFQTPKHKQIDLFIFKIDSENMFFIYLGNLSTYIKGSV